MEEEWGHREKRQELCGSHSPDAFAGKSLHTSVILLTPKLKALDECLRISGVLCFIKETDPRPIPWLYLHVQHKSAHSFPKIPTIHTQLPFFSLQGKILWVSSRQSNTVFHIWNPAAYESLYKSRRGNPCLKWGSGISMAFSKPGDGSNVYHSWGITGDNVQSHRSCNR